MEELGAFSQDGGIVGGLGSKAEVTDYCSLYHTCLIENFSWELFLCNTKMETKWKCLYMFLLFWAF